MTANGFGRQILAGLAAWGLATAMPVTGSAGQRTGDLRGQIVDARTSTPLQGVEISFVDLDFSARTDADGRYAITNIPAGRYTLLVRGRGFKPAIAPRYVLMSDTVNVLDFELDPLPPSEPAPVPDDEDSRRATYASSVFGPNDLPQNYDLILALEQRVPGMDFSTPTTGAQPRVTLRGTERRVLWVVDGTVVTPPLTITLNTSEVSCVEVRRGASAAQRFARAARASREPATYSGVILVWTYGSRSPMPKECESSPVSRRD